jgi:hypothetical protein
MISAGKPKLENQSTCRLAIDRLFFRSHGLVCSSFCFGEVRGSVSPVVTDRFCQSRFIHLLFDGGDHRPSGLPTTIGSFIVLECWHGTCSGSVPDCSQPAFCRSRLPTGSYRLAISRLHYSGASAHKPASNFDLISRVASHSVETASLVNGRPTSFARSP